MAKVVFYCKDSKAGISDMEYYQQDIQAIKELGHEVVVCNRYSQIPGDFDLIYIWWWTYALWPVLLAKIKRRKSVVTGVFNFRHDQHRSAHDYFSRPWWQKFLLRRALLGTDMNLFISALETGQCKEYFGTERIVHVPCSVGSEYHQQGQLEKELGIFNICWSGTLNLRRKGVFDILDAVKLLVEKGLRFPVRLAGKRGDGHEELVRAVQERGLSGHVQLLGEISKAEKLRLLSSIAVYVQPSYFEGFGLATAEAMASGACVITCDVGEVRYVVGDCAVFVQPGDSVALAAAIEKALSDPLHRQQMQRRAQERMMARFSYSAKVQSLRREFEALGVR